ncbi:hypothetical protein I553_0431 [Mycobacterium xenopi 4042]|uniref:Uncharacterized protein n=1 Tax=Mycobacterium xenopi 4042 TaxID=1299334 RepID=X7YIR0_MYCXE|nr:hypothetical protein I553_0431 [Mycobacterium xenopi 4042]
MCDALDLEGTALPLLTRRRNEDCLSDEVYAAVPFRSVSCLRWPIPLLPAVSSTRPRLPNAWP